MKTTIIQSNLTAGELSPDMAARVDHDIFYRGVSKAQNVVIMPHGGLRRRPGLTKTEDSKIVDGRMFAFEFSSDQDYLVFISPGELKIFKDGVLQATLVSPYNTIQQCKDLDGVQSGDVMILTYETFYPRMLRRLGSHTDWELITVPLSNIPVYDFGTGDEPVWSTERGFPSVCTFFQSRLWFAGSTWRPNSVWASKINSFYDFDIGTGQADYAIFDTLDTDQYNQITNIYPGRNLMVFTTGSEFYNVAEFITSETSSWKRSTSYGSKRIRPVLIDGAALFVDRVGRTVRSAVFEFQEDAYTAHSISLLSDHLIKDVVSMDTVKGTNIDVSDFVYIVNADGTLAVLNTIRHEQLQGWTEWITQGNFIDVIVINKIVYFLVERAGEYHIEYMNEGTTLDHNTVETGTQITEVDTSESATIAQLTHKILLDDSVMADQKGGVITLPRPAYKAEVGLDVELIVRSMPLNQQTQEGMSLNNRKRVIKVLLNVRDTLGLFAFDQLSPDRRFTVVLDEAPQPFSGLKEIFLLGFGRIVVIELRQDNPLPFKLLGLGAEVEV